MTEFPVTVVDAGSMVRAALLLPGCPPERALAAFTDPVTLRQWWGGEPTFTPAEGATAKAGSTSWPGSASCWRRPRRSDGSAGERPGRAGP